MLAAVVATILVLVALQIFTATPLYRATATLQIDPENQKVLPYEEVDTSSSSGWYFEEYLWTQAEKLQSTSLGRRVTARLGLADHPAMRRKVRSGALTDAVAATRGALRSLLGGASEEPEPTAGEPPAPNLISGLEVETVRGTRLIRVSFDSPNAALSAQVANTVVEEFIEQHLESRFQATTRASEFLQRQLDELKVAVERSEEALLSYARANNIVNLGERETLERKRLSDLNDEFTRAESEMIARRARYEALRNAPAELLAAQPDGDRIARVASRLSEAELQLAGMSGHYGPEWPAVKRLRLEIAELREQLESERRAAIGSAQRDYQVARERYRKLLEAETAQRRLVEALNEASIQYNILKRESDTNKELYEGLLQRLKEAGVAAGLRSSNIRMADQAEVPTIVAYPKKARTLTLALVVGLLLGVGGAFLMEALDSTIKSAEDVSQYLDLPALGIVPRIVAAEADGGRPRLGRRRKGSPKPLLVFNTSRTQQGRAMEAYRSLRASILLSHSGTPPQTMLVTSALPGEGKSTTASNTAISLAQTGARTLIMDLDMRKSSLSELFGVPSEQGMSTYLTGNSDLSSQIRHTEYPDLYVVSAGPPAPNPPELIGAERMLTGLQLVREYFTYVVLDTPPCLEISDALLLSPRVDGVILVVRGGKTPRKAVRRAAEAFNRIGASLLGVLVNEVDAPRTPYGYYYDSYGRYYGDYVLGESDAAKKAV